MTGPGDLEIRSPADGNPVGGSEIIALGPDDFQRIGLHPKETRLAVIRHAASRTARSLALSQLTTPNPITEQQLLRIALSTYRLLDPRQRGDRQSRAHVGRIRPGELIHAGRAAFADGRGLDRSVDDGGVIGGLGESITPGDDATDQALALRYDRGPRVVPVESVSLAAAEYLLEIRPVSRLPRLRMQLQRPLTIVAIMIALLIAAIALWSWGQSVQSMPGPLRPPVNQSAE
ncbi:hypothetical protein NHH03_20805 [Stieleria sp. TO1_6]|uniref:hypothetical protein n=1 Tax=Stieleria tagensis TaxID=2956795 RepID=UPI00209A8594|nr:hypothetical protein [Stieleria tagensis]MCO8124196.1 hypothetical protein [Stieleria tagensis]